MPAVSAKQYGLMQAARSGKIKAIAPELADEFIKKTSKPMRSKFSKELAKKRFGK